MRDLDTIAVMDMEKQSAVWATRGPWRGQHDAQFLDNGHLLVFDNLGSPQGSRVLEFDPQDEAFPWSYPGDNGTPFFTRQRGMCQRLPNGNTLIVNSAGSTNPRSQVIEGSKGDILEVSPTNEVVWTCTCDGYINWARRYQPGELHYLKENERPRP
jgi:hypothetical protein